MCQILLQRSGRLHRSDLLSRRPRIGAAGTGSEQVDGRTDCTGSKEYSRPPSSCTLSRDVQFLQIREIGSMCTSSFLELVQCCPNPSHLEDHSPRLRRDQSFCPCPCLSPWSSPSFHSPARGHVGRRPGCHTCRRADQRASIAYCLLPYRDVHVRELVIGRGWAAGQQIQAQLLRRRREQIGGHVWRSCEPRTPENAAWLRSSADNRKGAEPRNKVAQWADAQQVVSASRREQARR